MLRGDQDFKQRIVEIGPSRLSPINKLFEIRDGDGLAGPLGIIEFVNATLLIVTELLEDDCGRIQCALHSESTDDHGLQEVMNRVVVRFTQDQYAA